VVTEVCEFLKEKGMSIDWVLQESIDGLAYQTLDICRLHEKWKIAPYDRIVVNRTRREGDLRQRLEKRKAKEVLVKILQQEKSGWGFRYLISFNNNTPKWITRSLITAWNEAISEEKNQQNPENDNFYYDDEDNYYDDYDDFVDNDCDNEDDNGEDDNGEDDK